MVVYEQDLRDIIEAVDHFVGLAQYVSCKDDQRPKLLEHSSRSSVYTSKLSSQHDNVPYCIAGTHARRLRGLTVERQKSATRLDTREALRQRGHPIATPVVQAVGICGSASWPCFITVIN
jgi:hypothetical protein